MKATGIINTVGKAPGGDVKYGTEVAPGGVGHCKAMPVEQCAVTWRDPAPRLRRR